MPLDIRFELPAELVVLPAALVVLAIVAYRSRLADTRTIAWRAIAVAWGAAVVATTLFPFRVILGAGADPIDLDAVNVLPLVRADAAGLALNAVLFLPLGVIVAVLVRGTTLRRVALTALLASLAIEIVQLLQGVLLSGARAFDVDDLIANTAGALAGYGLYRIATSRWFGVLSRTRQTVFSSSAHAEP